MEEAWWQSKWIVVSSWIFGLLGLLGVVLTALSMFSARTGSNIYWSASDPAVLIPPYQGIVADEIAQEAQNGAVQISQFDIWNSGRRGVTAEDKSYIYVSSPNRSILDLRWQYSNFESAPLDTKCDVSGCRIDIEYLRQGHGHRFTLVMSGTGDSDISVTGTVISGSVSKLFSYNALNIFFLSLTYLFSFSVCALIMKDILKNKEEKNRRFTRTFMFVSFVGILFSLCALFFCAYVMAVQLTNPATPF